jgi:hypothetical protein
MQWDIITKGHVFISSTCHSYQMFM